MAVEGSTSWGTGIEEQTLGFVIFSLQSWLIRTEQRMTQILKPQNVYAKYALAGLLRGDTKARAEFYTKMWNLGVFSTNDIRRFEEMAPVEGGDVRYRPLNMGVLGAGDANTVDPNNPFPAGTDTSEQTDADKAAAIAAVAQKAYLAVDGNKMLTAEEGRTLLITAGMAIDAASPFIDDEPAPVPAVPETEPVVPDPTLEPADA
jgi:hypothetical protein